MAIFGATGFDVGESFTGIPGSDFYVVGGNFPGGVISKLESYCKNRAGDAGGQYNDFDYAIYAGGSSSGPSGATLQWNSKRWSTNVSIGQNYAWQNIVDAGSASPNISVGAGWIWVVLRSNDGIEQNKALTANQGNWDTTLDTLNYSGTGDAPGTSWPTTFAANGARYTDAMAIRLTYAVAGVSVPIVLNSIRQRVN